MPSGNLATRLYKRERKELVELDIPNKAGEVRRTFLHRSPVKLPSTAVPVAKLPEGRIAKIMPVAKPPGKLKLVWLTLTHLL